MRSAIPPKLASWLLCHQVGGYRAESLVGDLTEEYAQGRRAGWFWRQVLSAVARSFASALRMHGLHFLGAVAAGWGALLLGIALLGWTQGLVQHELDAIRVNFPAQQSQALEVFLGVAWTLLAAGIDFTVGRLVVRIYRPHQRLIAGVFALTILFYMLPSIYEQLITTLADAHHAPFLMEEMAATFLWMGSAWFGGLLQIRVDTKSTKRQPPS